jgi:hypothetical protein
MALAVLALNYIGGTALVFLVFRAYPDHSFSALTSWGMLYLFGAIAPIHSAIRCHRWLRKQHIEITALARALVISPLIAGGLTLLAALDLLRRLLHS